MIFTLPADCLTAFVNMFWSEHLRVWFTARIWFAQSTLPKIENLKYNQYFKSQLQEGF